MVEMVFGRGVELPPVPPRRGRKMKRPRAGGFTLIELLVVIAVIAVIAAILFPVFAQAREKARQPACLSNPKQIGTAALMYTEDYDDVLPWNPAPGGKPKSYWDSVTFATLRGSVYPYRGQDSQTSP